MKLIVKFKESNQRITPKFGEVFNVSDGGFDRGYAEGYGKGEAAGHKAGRTEGIEQGKQAEYDRFWDVFQDNGERRNYQTGFFSAYWSDETYNPKYPIVATTASSMFDRATITDTKVAIEINGCVADTAFIRCQKLKTIRKLILRGVTRFTNTFTNCFALEEINKLEGSIDASFNIQATGVLSVETAKRIILCLTNYAGTENEYAHTLKLNDAVWAALEADSVSPNGSTWADYVNDLGWNT